MCAVSILIIQVACQTHGINNFSYISDNMMFLVINQLDAQNLFYNTFISCLYMFRAPCAHRQEVKIVLYSLWFHHTL